MQKPWFRKITYDLTLIIDIRLVIWESWNDPWTWRISVLFFYLSQNKRLKVSYCTKIKGKPVPQSRTTVIKLNVISMGGSSYKSSREWGGQANIELLAVSYHLAAFSSTLLEQGWLVLNLTFCPLLVCTTPMVGISCRSDVGDTSAGCFSLVHP